MSGNNTIMPAAHFVGDVTIETPFIFYPHKLMAQDIGRLNCQRMK